MLRLLSALPALFLGAFLCFSIATPAVAAEPGAALEPAAAAAGPRTEAQAPAAGASESEQESASSAHGGGQEAGSGHGEGHDEPWSPPAYAVLPFVLMLLCIAVIPLVNHHWWENDKHRLGISLALGLPTLAFVYFDSGGHWHHMIHEGQEYVSFISLLGSLFVISGGIVITGNLRGTPMVNTSFLAAGGLMASFIGTTGAAMVLIRALLRTNSERHHKLHTVIFFIFIVCNCGGCLTPLGDPPLFLGYLRGVPFDWTFGLWPGWLMVCGALLVIYFIFDTIQYRKEAPKDLKLDEEHDRPLIVRGAHNFLFLGGVVFAVAKTDWFSFPSREGFMWLMAILAWVTTRKQNRADNSFTFGPIIEVAVVFLGIFSTMIPALVILNANGSEFGINEPMQFFWVTGGLSSFLDNAPTYVAFIEMADGITQWPEHLTHHALAFGKNHPAFEGEFAMLAAKYPGESQYVIPTEVLKGISYGAVFLGAMTYIGNGPNFMVRAIADSSGVKMPSFLGYMLWSCIFLLPVFAVVSWLLLS